MGVSFSASPGVNFHCKVGIMTGPASQGDSTVCRWQRPQMVTSEILPICCPGQHRQEAQAGGSWRRHNGLGELGEGALENWRLVLPALSSSGSGRAPGWQSAHGHWRPSRPGSSQMAAPGTFQAITFRSLRARQRDKNDFLWHEIQICVYRLLLASSFSPCLCTPSPGKACDRSQQITYIQRGRV